MRLGHRLLPAALLLLAAFPRPAAAQRETYSFVSYAGSEVSLVSSATDEEAARINTPILSGDRLVTGASSRAEAVLASGNLVRVDAKSELRFDRMARTYEADDDRDLLYLLRGAVAIDVRDAESGERAFRLDTDEATVVVEGRGQLRVDVGRRGTEIYVTAGEADVAGRGGRVTLLAGQYAYVRGSDPVEAESYDPPRDRFARFVDERRSRRAGGEGSVNVSADYDYESSVADFDSHGSWSYVPAYSRWCWRPTVAVDWRPYSLGYWRWTPCGLNWVSYEPWGWLPYHYGSWAFDASFGWCWLPGTEYAPAWVYWSYTPSYVGWCPTGFYGYYDTYYRSTRLWFGTDGGSRGHPHLRGRVDLTRVDPRGWNYVATGRLGLRLDPARDILRGDRVPIRPGQTAVVATAPLRIDRGSLPAPVAIQNAVRRIVTEPVAGRGGAVPVNEGLTSILRREPNLTPAAEKELRRSVLAHGRSEPLRSLSPEQLLAPRTGAREVPGRRGDDWRTSTAPAREAEAGTRTETRRRNDGWRSPASPAPRDVSPRPAERSGPTDTGWRAPRSVPRKGTAETPVRRRESDWREAPRRETSAPRADAPAPRRESPGRSYESPVRSYARPARSYEPPARSYAPPAAAPHVAPAPAPHAAPAPAPRAAPAAPRGDRQRH